MASDTPEAGEKVEIAGGTEKRNHGILTLTQRHTGMNLEDI